MVLNSHNRLMTENRGWNKNKRPIPEEVKRKIGVTHKKREIKPPSRKGKKQPESFLIKNRERKAILLRKSYEI